jgi:hypothetical protein
MGNLSVVQACALLVPDGYTRASTTEETAYISWDAKTQIQHFIRRASFDTDAEKLGFIVPTPSIPQLKANSDKLFKGLEDTTAPPVITKVRKDVRLTSLLLPEVFDEANYVTESDTTESQNTEIRQPPPAGVAGAPVVVRTEQVGDYTATILAAKNVASMDDWLKKNQFQSGPALREWLQPYVAKGWYLTAFKLSKPTDKKTTLEAVSLCFKTSQPFYPYREPASAREPGRYSPERTLRIYYVGEERGQGTLGKDKVWPGKVVRSDRPYWKIDDVLSEYAHSLGGLEQRHLTVFEDRAAPRPGTDEVYFSPAADQRRVMPPPTLVYADRGLPIPIEVCLLTLLYGGFWYRRSKMTD